jgi:Zn-dependent protease/CBS domain-containing protein
MLWSIPIARIAGTAVRLHVTFLLFLIWIGAVQWQVGGRDAAVQGVAFIVLLFACVLAHEFGHILVARRYGIKTPEVTLWPIGGIASLERIPDDPREELLIAIAGPLVNVAIAAALILIIGTGFHDALATGLDDPRANLLARIASANIILFLFNLIPAFPMDGGRVLRALLAMKLDHSEATRIATRIGQATAFVFAFAGLFVSPILILIGLFVYLAATAESQHVALQDGTRGLAVRSVMVRSVEALSASATLDEAVDLMLRTSQKEFPVVDEAGHPTGLLTRDGLILALRDHGPGAPVRDMMDRNFTTVEDWQPFETALTLLNNAKAPALLVLDRAHRLVGLVTPDNVAEMMMVTSVKPNWRFGRRPA